ncbi:MAG: alpha/beta hydrolase [Ruminococcaceae bacterium]|nr:alpha/beta hydrolase [Oscillospiraceae bacterium]
MKTFTLKLKEIFNLDTAQEPTLECYILDPNPETDPLRKHPSILVLPGGGYVFASAREAEPIALNYLSMGFNAFVLRYSVAPETYPEQLIEVSASIALMRQKSEEWFIDKDKIAVIGFSAGGHLAGSISTLWRESAIYEKLNIEKDLNKPNAAILSYPVITSDASHSHAGSFAELLGEKYSPETLEKVTLEKQVTPETPPTFIWHTANDACVPIMNSLIYSEALAKNNVPFELHIFPDGPHGLANCNITTAHAPDSPMVNPHCERWVELSKKWLTESCGF